MGIDVKDLPPAYQAQALQKWVEQERKKQGKPLHRLTGDGGGKPAKYHNTPTERVTSSGAVLRFDSQKEARRYDELMLMLKDGKIRGLKLQQQFTLQGAYTTAEGERVRAIRYNADFSYMKPSFVDRDGEWQWVLVVEDVKSRATRTKEYVMKRKLMKERFGINIQEV